MLSGYISDAGPSLLTVTVWAGLVRLFRATYNPKYVRKVTARNISDRKIIRKQLIIVVHLVLGFFLLFFTGMESFVEL